MKRITIIILCILTMLMSGCKKKTNADETPTVTITVSPTATEAVTKNVSEPEPNELTITPIPTPVAVGKQEFTFQVQPISIPQNMPVPYMNKEDFPVLDGSTANIPLGQAVYSYLTGASEEEAKSDLVFHKTPESYEKLYQKESDILFVYEPSQTTLEQLEAEHAEFEYKPLGRDALVFIENESNPVNSLTKQQITDIYSGKIKNWSEVGGENMDILPFQRPATSGSQSLMEKLAVSVDVIMNGPQVVRPSEMGELIDELAAYNNQGNALGYSVFFYANYMYSKPGLKFVAIDGVMPTNETIQTCKYPYVNDFYVVIRKDEPQNSNARKLYNWMTSVEAQTILVNQGYVPVVNVAKDSNSSAKSHGVEINGSMKLNDNQLMILHNVSGEEVFVGDSLLDSKFNTLFTFPGKHINTDDQNLICSRDDNLIIESYRQFDDRVVIVDELYSLAKQCYLSEDYYDFIRKSDLGFYTCYRYNEATQHEEITIFTPNGSVVHPIKNYDLNTNCSIVQDRIVVASGNEVILYDQSGKELTRIQLE